ncbi:hypothetical protein V6N13_094387 [Hibiscus sabdariffa]
MLKLVASYAVVAEPPSPTSSTALAIDGEVQGLLFHSPFIYELPINNVHCNDCNRHIGVKFISAADNDPPRPYPLEGKVLFYLDRTLYWDGNCFLRNGSGEPVMRLIFFDGTQLRYTGPCPDEETDKEDSQQTKS